MNIPSDFISLMRKRLDNDFVAFESSLQQPTPTSIRINSFKKIDTDYLSSDGKVPWNSDGYYLSKRPLFTMDPHYHAGAYYVQEASSMFLKEALEQWVDLNTKPLKILDLCAAPGGKSTLISDLNSMHLLVANEVIKSRFHILVENLERWGTRNKIITNHDVKDFEALSGYFDIVLIDAPCSGEGLFRKDPAACREWSRDNVNLCSSRQKRILAGAQKLVAPGGLLVYCTCTYNEQENINNVKWMSEEFHLKSMSLKLNNNWGIEEIKKSKSVAYQFFPHRIRGEGFFISGLKKESGDVFTLPKKHKNKKSVYPSVSKYQRQILSNHLILNAKGYYFYDAKENIYTIDEEWITDVRIISSVLDKCKPGLPIGKILNEHLVPHHSLALCPQIQVKFPSLNVDRISALKFLKKESFDINTDDHGWHLVKYNGLNLGWVKLLGTRMNNYLPKHLRIRMELPKAIISGNPEPNL